MEVNMLKIDKGKNMSEEGSYEAQSIAENAIFDALDRLFNRVTELEVAVSEIKEVKMNFDYMNAAVKTLNESYAGQYQEILALEEFREKHDKRLKKIKHEQKVHGDLLGESMQEVYDLKSRIRFLEESLMKAGLG
jgi:hypothetical protein